MLDIMYNVRMLIVASLVLMTFGCASIMNGKHQMIPVQSDPPGATVRIDGKPSGVTPTIIPCLRKRPPEIVIECENYITQTVELERRLSGWIYLDPLLPLPLYGIIGIPIDFLNGSAWTLTPEEIDIKLKPSCINPNTEKLVTSSTDKSNYGAKWAIIIGISEYQVAEKGGLPELHFAKEDALMFKNALTDAGWKSSHIKCLTDKNATKRNVEIALESWLSKAKKDDFIVLYWAGHGYPDPDDPEKVYFACYDTDTRIPATGYRMDRLRQTIEEQKAKNVLLLADSCHAGKLVTRGDRGLSIIPSVKKMQQRNSIPSGWVFMVSADTDRKAIEHSSWRNGAFTYCLLQGLNGKADGFQSSGPEDGIITIGELRAYLTTTMPDETQRVLGTAKHPLIATSTGNPDIWNLTLQDK